MARSKPQKRHRFLVDPEVQHAFLRHCALHWAIFLLATFLLTFLIQFYSGPDEGSFVSHLSTFWDQHGLMSLVLISLLPVFLLDIAKMTNRFAGPIVRLRRAIRATTRGEQVEPVKFRSGDFWHDLSDEFNVMLATIETRTATDHRRQTERHTARDTQGRELVELRD